MSDTQLLVGIALFLVAVAFLNQMGLPSEYQFISNYALAGIGVSALAVTAACVLTTGVVCAATLVVTNVALTAFLLVSAYPIVTTLITGPLNLFVSWILYRQARGNPS